MERNTSDPTVVASAELPRRGREDEPRHVYVHEDGRITMELRMDYEDMVGPDAYQRYLQGVDARRGTRYADPNYVPFEQPTRQPKFKRLLSTIGIQL
ncbi:MAG: hypothetical protein WDN66_01930 [Candidatus Saccharibacteria bacterium]